MTGERFPDAKCWVSTSMNSKAYPATRIPSRHCKVWKELSFSELGGVNPFRYAKHRGQRAKRGSDENSFPRLQHSYPAIGVLWRFGTACGIVDLQGKSSQGLASNQLNPSSSLIALKPACAHTNQTRIKRSRSSEKSPRSRTSTDPNWNAEILRTMPGIRLSQLGRR